MVYLSSGDLRKSDRKSKKTRIKIARLAYVWRHHAATPRWCVVGRGTLYFIAVGRSSRSTRDILKNIGAAPWYVNDGEWSRGTIIGTSQVVRGGRGWGGPVWHGAAHSGSRRGTHTVGPLSAVITDFVFA